MYGVVAGLVSNPPLPLSGVVAGLVSTNPPLPPPSGVVVVAGVVVNPPPQRCRMEEQREENRPVRLNGDIVINYFVVSEIIFGCC
jgi:hypothetical protein